MKRYRRLSLAADEAWTAREKVASHLAEKPEADENSFVIEGRPIEGRSIEGLAIEGLRYLRNVRETGTRD
jgi:hypothetical protein